MIALTGNIKNDISIIISEIKDILAGAEEYSCYINSCYFEDATTKEMEYENEYRRELSNTFDSENEFVLSLLDDLSYMVQEVIA